MRTGRTVERLEPERLRFWQGQRLDSADLLDQLAHVAELRWWHNRALHDAYGVVDGLWLRSLEAMPALIPPPVFQALSWALPRLSFNALRVSPGTAHDGYGRELDLRRPITVDPPAIDVQRQSWVLVLRHRAGRQEGAQHLDPTAVDVRWTPERDATPQRDVPLAGGQYVDLAQLFHDPNLPTLFVWSPHEVQARARPMARPTLGHGATPPGRTDWRPWSKSLSRTEWVHGVEVTVDTSAAGFQNVPCTFAWLHGSVAGPELRQQPPPLALGRIVDATADRFTYSLWFVLRVAQSSTGLKLDDLAALARRQLSLCWLGVEPRPRGFDFKRELTEVTHVEF